MPATGDVVLVLDVGSRDRIFALIADASRNLETDAVEQVAAVVQHGGAATDGGAFLPVR